MGVWKWASNDEGSPDVVMACCGDVPTLETLAAVHSAAQLAPDLKIRVVNVVDLMALQPQSEHPHGLPDEELRPDLPAGDAGRLRLPRLSVADSPAHLPAAQPRQPPRARLQGRGHHDHALRHVRAQQHRPLPVALDAIRRVPRLAAQADAAEQWYSEAIQRHKLYVAENGDDLPEIRNWRWPKD
jgi:xylulose-5-phosphate/fructose-6-phosphate phosphoketolase